MRILFVTSTRIGDAVLSTGLLSHLIERHPDARITLACGPLAAPLFAATPNIERVIVLAKRAAGLHWLGLWRACCTTVWHLVVDLRRSAIAYALLARRRLVLSSNSESIHWVQALADLAGLDPAPAPRLWTAPEHEAEAASLVPDGAPVLALGPTANWLGKQWRAERFTELARRLTASDAPLPGARIAVFGAAEERPAAEPVLDAIPPEHLIDLVGRVDLLTAYAALERCALYVGNDSGLMHIAAASGVPTLGLFGPSRDQRYAPWGARTAVARTSLSYDELIGGPGYDHRTTGTLMDSLSVDAAEAAARDLWSRAAEPG